MSTNWTQILQTLVATIGGGGVILGAAAWLIKAVVSNRLELDAEKLKVQIRSDADTQIERVKADLTRSLHVHERQLDILGRLYRHLQEAQALFQGATRAGRFEGEIKPEEYMPLVVKAMDSARDELVQGRLLIPPALVQQCDAFFKAVFEGRLDFSFANNPVVDPTERAKYWNSAAKVAYQELPKVLQQIDEAARILIHGERS